MIHTPICVLALAATCVFAQVPTDPASPGAPVPAPTPGASGWNWIAGAKHRYLVTSVHTLSTPGQTHSEVKQSQRLIVTQQVLGVSSERDATIRQSIESVSIAIERSGAKIELSSDAPPSSKPVDPHKPLRVLVGTSYTVTVNRLGKVVKAEGAAETLATLMDPLKDVSVAGGDGAGAAVAAKFAQAFTPEALARSVEASLAWLSPEARGSGGALTWTASSEIVIPEFLGLGIETTYSRAPEQSASGEIVIQSAGTMTITSPPSSDLPLTRVMSVSLAEGVTTGNATIDRERTHIVRSECTATLRLKLTPRVVDPNLREVVQSFVQTLRIEPAPPPAPAPQPPPAPSSGP